MSATQIGLDAVSVQLGAQTALTGVSLRIKAGERVALVGANGSGKSTLLRTLHGLVPPTQGQVQQAPGVRQAMLFQRPHLLRLSALNNVALGLWLDRSRGLSWAAAKVLALQALQRVGLQSVPRQNGRQLSGGQQQRAALARAMAPRPQVLLMDEPFGALDALTRAHLQDSLMNIQDDLKNTVVMITHDVDEAVLLSDRIVMMTNGPSATIGQILNVDLPRPRDRLALADDPTYNHYRHEVLRFLHEKQRKVEAIDKHRQTKAKIEGKVSANG